MASREERETTITYGPLDDDVRIWTSSPRDLAEMRRRVTAGQAREVETGPDWADFRVPAGGWTLKGFRRTATMTPEQRSALAERARKQFGNKK